MLVRKFRVSAASVFVFALFLSPHLALANDPPFQLGGKSGSAVAIVTKPELNLAVDIGKKEDYPDPKMFTLTIGGCAVDLKMYFDKEADGVQSLLTEQTEALGSVLGLNSIVATSGCIKFKSKGLVPVNCTVNFVEKDGSYNIKVELSGSGVPSVLLLTSPDAKMEKNEAESAGMSLVLLLGLIAGVAVLLLSLIAGVGFSGYRHHKKRALKREKEQLRTAKGLEDPKTPVPAVKPVEETLQAPEAKPVESKTSELASKSSSKPLSKRAKPKDKLKGKPKDKPKDKLKSASKDKRKDGPKDKRKSKRKAKPKIKPEVEPTDTSEAKLIISGKVVKGSLSDSVEKLLGGGVVTEQFQAPEKVRASEALPARDTGIAVNVLDYDASVEFSQAPTFNQLS